MSAIVWLGIAGLFFTDLTRLAGKLSFVFNAVAPTLAALVVIKPEESMPERTTGSVERSRGETTLTSPLGWPIYLSGLHRRRDRR